MKDFFYHLVAALSSFTRLPFGRIANVPESYYENLLPYWPVVGWLNGCVMALIFLATRSLPTTITILLCLGVRCLLTGAIHENSFSKFCDGFGGGKDRQSILNIFSDKNIGTYGVIGLIFYFAVLANIMSYLYEQIYTTLPLFLLMISADSICKCIASSITYFLPNANKEVAGSSLPPSKSAIQQEMAKGICIAMLPVILLALIAEEEMLSFDVLISTICSGLVAAVLSWQMKRKIGGYTTDCCGATFIISEMCFYVVLLYMVGK